MITDSFTVAEDLRETLGPENIPQRTLGNTESRVKVVLCQYHGLDGVVYTEIDHCIHPRSDLVFGQYLQCSHRGSSFLINFLSQVNF